MVPFAVQAGRGCSTPCHLVLALAGALRAAEPRLVLPFEAQTRERLEADLRRVRARLN